MAKKKAEVASIGRKSVNAKTMSSPLKLLKAPTQQQSEDKKKKGPPGIGKR